MTSFETKFEVGQKAWTVDTDTLKVVEFEIGKISCSVSKAGAQVFLHPMKDGSPQYTGYRESVCFETREQLKSHLESN